MAEKKKHRITLIDILVLVAIIALILAIVIPVVDHGRPPVRLIICKSNIRYLDIGLLCYHEENETWPASETWCDLLHQEWDVEAEQFRCPFDNIGPCSYAMNEAIPADASELPDDFVVLFESAPGWNKTGGPADVVTDRHGKPGANIAFADGHVEFVKPEEIPNLRWTVEEQ